MQLFSIRTFPRKAKGKKNNLDSGLCHMGNHCTAPTPDTSDIFLGEGSAR